MHVTKSRWRPQSSDWRPLSSVRGGAHAQNAAFAEKLTLCGACHGEDGNSQIENIPSLAGQPAFFVLNQLFLMREGVRKVEAMAPIVKDLTDDDLNAFGAYYAKLPPKPSGEKIDPALVQRGAELAKAKACASCHGAEPGGCGSDPPDRETAHRLPDLRLEVLPRRHPPERRHHHEQRRREPVRQRSRGACPLLGIPVARRRTQRSGSAT